MKKSLIALAVLGAFTGAASAQSSVTLFGVVDVGVRAVRNGDSGTVKSLTSNGLASSRLGFRGEEDLGSGLKASFWLEADIGPDVGSAGGPAFPAAANGATQSAKFFNRRSTVSLLSPLGEIRLGRDYTPNFLMLPTYDVYGNVGIGAFANLLGPGASPSSSAALGSGVGTIVRADNSVAYFLPGNLGGFYGQVMAAAGEGTNTVNGNNRYIGGRLGWTGGPFDVSAAYGRTRIPGNDDFRSLNIGGAYTLPVVKLVAQYYRTDYQPTGLDNRTQKIWSVGFNVPIGQSEIRGTYSRSDIGGGGPAFIGLRNEDDARQYAIGYIYNLSKRTALYADVGRIQNRGLSQMTIGGGTLPGSNFGVVADRNSTGLALGVRHSF